MSLDKASATYALKVTASQLNLIDFADDDVITQTIGVGSTAIGRVVSWDANTGVLKYWQDSKVATSSTVGTAPLYGTKLLRFQNSLTGGDLSTLAEELVRLLLIPHSQVSLPF